MEKGGTAELVKVDLTMAAILSILGTKVDGDLEETRYVWRVLENWIEPVWRLLDRIARYQQTVPCLLYLV